MKRLAAIVAAAAALALLPAAKAIPPQLPSSDEIDSFYCFKDIKPCGDPVSLGRVRWESGPTLIYGFSSALGPCISYDHSGGGSGTCGGGVEPVKHQAIQINGLNMSVRDNRTTEYTEVAGVLRTDVASVTVGYRMKGKAKELDAFTFQVADDIQQKLKAEKPFGIFEASAAGCVPANHFRLTAFDANGAQLGSTRLADLKGNCRNPHPGTGGYIFFGRGKARAAPATGMPEANMLAQGNRLTWTTGS